MNRGDSKPKEFLAIEGKNYSRNYICLSRETSVLMVCAKQNRSVGARHRPDQDELTLRLNVGSVNQRSLNLNAFRAWLEINKQRLPQRGVHLGKNLQRLQTVPLDLRLELVRFFDDLNEKYSTAEIQLDGADSLPAIKKRKKRIIVYGAGEAFHWFYEIAVVQLKIPIDLIIDQRADEIKTIKKYKCVTLEQASEFLSEKENLHVIVCVGSYQTYTVIRDQLKSRGFKKIGFYGAYFEIQYLNYSAESTYRKSNWIDLFEKNFLQIVDARESLSDATSKHIFDQVLWSFCHKKALQIDRSAAVEQYFPRDIEGYLNQFDILINCGAYDGEVIKRLSDQQLTLNAIYAFEPDPAAFAKLERCVKNHVTNKVQAYNCAVSNTAGTRNFEAANGLGPRLCKNGTRQVKVVKLDDFSFGDGRVLITMDIQGEELAAINGASKLIRARHPSLAICTYHKPEHTWAVLSRLKLLNPEYKFAMRNYTGFITETVLYAY